LESLKQLSKDKGIDIIETNKIVTCFAVWDDEKEQKYIFLRKNNYLKNLKMHDLSHELGHSFLHQKKDYNYLSSSYKERECEANYFAKKLLNKTNHQIERYLNAFFLLITKPLASLKYAIFNKDSDLKIFKDYIKQ